MSKRFSRSSMEIAPPVVPAGYRFGAGARKRRLAVILAMTLLAIYVGAAYFVFGPTQPAVWQRLLAIGCASLALAVYLALTRQRESTDEIVIRARLAQRSDFGKQQLQAWMAKQERSVTLPWVGKISLRSLGGLAVFALTALWWLTPLAPVRVQERTIDDLTVPFGEDIAAAVLVVPDGHIAVVGPPMASARQRQLARSIEDDANSYNRGLKAIAEGRHGEARTALNAALTEGKPDRAQVQLARAQNEMYAGLFTDAARIYESVAQQTPNSAMLLVQTAIAWLHVGAAESAEPLIARAIRACQGKSAEQEREMAYCLHAKAMLRIVQGRQFGEAEACCAQARELIEHSPEKSAPFLAASLNNEAVLYLLEGKYPGAINRFEEARYNWAKAYGPRHPLAAANMANQAALYVVLGEYRNAEEWLSRAEELGRELLPEDHPFSAQTQTCRALLQQALGKYADGLSAAADALAIVEKALGTTHPANVPALRMLASLEADQGMYRRAATLGQRAIDLSRRVWGPQHPFFAQMLAQRAQLNATRQRFARAESDCREAFGILGQSLGKEHPETATVLDTWGRLEFQRQRPGEARSYLDKALTIREETFGKEHPAVARTLANLATLENSPRTFSKGEAAYKRAIAIAENLLGAEHPEVARLLRGQAILFTEEDKFAEAAADLDRALAIEEKTLPPFHPELAATLDSYAALLRATSPPNPQRAAEMESRANSVRQKHEEVDESE